MIKYRVRMNNICVNYKKDSILSNITLALEPGKVYGLFSKNGIGKTTLLKVLSGLYEANSGELDYRENTRVGYSIDDSLLVEGLTVEENIIYYAKLNGLQNPDTERLDQIIELTGVGSYRSKRVKRLSKGMKQRTSLAISLVGQPDLLVLDEAVSGVDIVSRRKIAKELRGLAEKNNVCIVSADHDVSNLISICDAIIFLRDNSEIEICPMEKLLRGNTAISTDAAEQIFVDMLENRMRHEVENA
ncbi:MAG: ABC transporter ATP-binding protein [Clostridiaceae bacterium]|nr:ABC transporter ATP-binding protein [Clostridiaceae bacterium]